MPTRDKVIVADAPQRGGGPVTHVFLMTDVVGSTSLWELFGDEMPAVLARHDELVHGAVAAAGGTVFKHTGDGMIAVFDDADQAAAAAAAALRELRFADWSPLGELRIRCSIHAGPATERDGDYFGPSLNRVARINGAAQPGQVLISNSARRLMQEPPIIDLGEHQLRDLGHPIRLWQFDDGEHAPLTTMRTGLHNLPNQLTEFVGRRDEITQLGELLRDHHLISLTGVGGCGKTRLAIELGARASEHFPGGVWFVDLRSVEDDDQIIQQIAASIGLLAGGGAAGADNLSDLVIEYVDRGATLIILDNCEHLVDDAADVADHLLRSAVELRIVATTREALAVEGEQVWRIPSMAIESGDARELFMTRAFAANSDFGLDRKEPELVDEICARLDGIPLAIELAAARVAHLSLADLNARLDERFSLLSGGRRARRQRQQTLQAMMDWSWELLDADEQQMLPELAVFRGGFDARGVEEVCSPPTQGTRFEVLSSLVDRSLIAVAADQGAAGRYQLLETVRLYGLGRLTTRGDTITVRDRHSEWVRGFNSCRQVAMFDAAEVNYATRNADNMIAALEWFAANNDPISVAEVASGRFGSFAAEHNVEGLRWLGTDVLEEPSLPYDVRLAAHFAAGQVRLLSGDYESWFRIARKGLALINRHSTNGGDNAHTWEASICLQSAMTELDSGRAPALYDRAVELWPDGQAHYPLFDIVGATLALVEGNPAKALEISNVTAADLENVGIISISVKVMDRAIALSLLDRHAEAVEMAAHLFSDAVIEMPNTTAIIQMAFVHHRAGDSQKALDLVRHPSRLTVGRGLASWRFGRALLLAEILIDIEPDLAAQLVGCESMHVVTLGYRRRSLLERLHAHHGPALESLLAEGESIGEEALVARAHELLQAAGFTP